MIKKSALIILAAIIFSGCITVNTRDNAQPSPTTQTQPSPTLEGSVLHNDLFVITKAGELYTLHNMSNQTLYFYILDNDLASRALWQPCRNEAECKERDAWFLGANGTVEFHPTEYITAEEGITSLVINGWTVSADDQVNLKTENLSLTE